VRQVAEVHPALGCHLQNAVRTGTWCSYRPETAVAWEVSGPERPPERETQGPSGPPERETQGRRA
jgi:hypothetical protein